MNTKEIAEAIGAKYSVSTNDKLDRTINRAIRTLPGGTELLAAIEAANAARNHAQRARAVDRIIATDAAIERLESIRDAMSRHILDSVGASDFGR